ncbi:MAG: thioredoxin family protein [Robiginitomaculum sp.]|nr:thioredoxin family protein [Robiginitomaculum sp.]MDQ7078582.1 thioredoxin family protein [Robiginitomaculum sp.]
MALMHTPICDFGWQAPDFDLPDTDGEIHTLQTLRGPKGLLLMFICNHCPYVLAIIDRLVREAKAVQGLGVGVAAIMPNDWTVYPADAPDKMAAFARKNGFTFPYLIDAEQSVARAYDAVCTPDFFGFDADLGLQYRGRLDASGRNAASPDARRELYEAMQMIAAGQGGPRNQTSSMGCSIKWMA